jgi:hypothetical protein
MEPEACLSMIIDLHDNANCVVFRICADDDASTRSLIRWSNADHMRNHGTTEVPKVFVSRGPNKGVKQQPRPDRGRLPGHIPEPLFVADPNHRRKVYTGELLTVKMSKVAERFTMTKMDCTRLGKNFGYMVRTLKRRPEEEWEARGRAVIEHHFDNHEFCGEWCPRKRQGQEERDAKARYYRSKTEDAKLYTVFNNITTRFITLDRLKEVAHGMDTQINESFNNTASWFAPKNKVYCGSQSLANRLSLAVGIQSIGIHQYFARLFRMLRIAMPPNVAHFLAVKQNIREKRHDKRQLKETKKERAKRKMEQLAADEVIAKKEKSKRDGTYKKGQNMEAEGADGYTAAELLAAAAAPPKRNNKSRKTNKDIVCKFCNLAGHSTRRSTKCLYNKDRETLACMPTKAVAQDAPISLEEADRMAREDMLTMDAMDLDNDDVSVDASFALYEDAGTWTDDDDKCNRRHLSNRLVPRYSNRFVLLVLVPLLNMLLCLERQSNILVKITKAFSFKYRSHNFQNTGYVLCTITIQCRRGALRVKYFDPRLAHSHEIFDGKERFHQPFEFDEQQLFSIITTGGPLQPLQDPAANQ